jgi:predicted rRNA methylase YqxC with S4 and FtsJ domains
VRRLVDTKEYWEQRLRSFCSLEGVGCIGLGNFFNSYVYRAKIRTLERINRKFKKSFKESEVLDVGSGIGFWIAYYLSKGARLIYGVDIASETIKYLARKYAVKIT